MALTVISTLEWRETEWEDCNMTMGFEWYSPYQIAWFFPLQEFFGIE